MKPFPNENFMLHSETARALYTKAAKDAPVYDYHCHLSPKEIYEDGGLLRSPRSGWGATTTSGG